MKLHAYLSLLIILRACSGFTQGTLVYDQQSTSGSFGGEAAFKLVADQPLGQSFIPALSAIDFVTLCLNDGNLNNGIGATIYVNLFSGSLTNGTLLASTTPLLLQSGFGVGANAPNNKTNFFFSTTIALTLGTTYYLRPVLQSGDSSFQVTADTSFNYGGGTAFYQGAPVPNFDLYFREGIIAVPEPSSMFLLLVGVMVLFFGWRLHCRKLLRAN